MKHPNKNRTALKTTSPQQKESGSPDKAPEATQYKEYISKRNQNINFSRQKFERKKWGKNNPRYLCQPGQRIGSEETRRWQFKTQGVQVQRCCWPTKQENGEAWHQQPQNISDNKDVYNHKFIGIWENDALDYLPDESNCLGTRVSN